MEIILTDKNFESEVLKEKVLPVIVDFFAEWCGPCKMMAPAFEKMAEEFEGKVKLGKLNIDENTETSGKYGITGIPTLVMFKNGEVVGQEVGFKSEEKLRELFKELLKK